MSPGLWGGRDTGHLRSFWCQGWRRQMADWDGLIRPSCLWWCLLEGSYWLLHGWNWPVQPKWILFSHSQWGTQATDIGLLRVLFPEAGLEVSSTIWDKSSWSLVAMLVWLTILLGLSAARCRKEGGVEALQGPGMKGILSLGIAHGKSTWSCEDLQTDLLRVFISHMGSCGMESCTGSSPPI